MPNHITNVIWFRCVAEKVAEIKDFMTTEGNESIGKTEFDFNNLIPMPKSLDVESGSRGDTGLMAYREYLRRSFGLVKEEAKKLEETYRERFSEDPEIWDLGKQYYENIENYGTANWYDWRIRNWGTKWNAYDVEWGAYSVLFQTAWSGVPEILEKLSERFPEVEMLYRWSDEDIGYNVGEFTMKDGHVIDLNIPNPGSKEAYDLAFEIHGVEPEEWGFYYDEKAKTYRYRDE